MSVASICRPPLCLAGTELPEPITISLTGGTAVVFTRASPVAGHDNEDALGVFEWDGEASVLAVADGLGGLPGGANASRQIVESLANPSSAADIDPVVSCLQSVNETLLQDGSGGGTTISIVVIQKPEATSYHVGDSATLIVSSDSQIKLETIPHSIIGVALSSGELDEKTAMHHPLRHVVQNIIGMPGMWVETAKPIELEILDTVILASDGLWDNLYRDEVVEQMAHPSLEEVAHGLIETASYRMKRVVMSEPGKPDDLSFILYRQRIRTA